ncbi:hypothetical protein ILYODFUR_005656 [Ilyodon furcidens]|uniref:Uncharacterized protein n=1 Tax=Ilyodon furcidens TaxID=33524 RepID=A0ABV0VBV1_9TELE
MFTHLQARHLELTTSVSELPSEKPHRCTLSEGSRGKSIQAPLWSSSVPAPTPSMQDHQHHSSVYPVPSTHSPSVNKFINFSSVS